jgi:hypothetical protein
MEQTHQHHDRRDVRIHIDEERYESPNPTTGDKLYALSHVKEGLVLYRQVTGDREDVVIPQGQETVHLTEDEHFHSGPPHHTEIKIFVNTREFIEKQHKLSYEAVVALAFPNPDFETHTYKATYFRQHDKHEGTLAKSESVRLTNEMVFTVIRAIKS